MLRFFVRRLRPPKEGLQCLARSYGLRATPPGKAHRAQSSPDPGKGMARAHDQTVTARGWVILSSRRKRRRVGALALRATPFLS